MASTLVTLTLDGEEIDPLSVGVAIRAFVELLAEIDRDVSPTATRAARFRLASLSYASPATIGIAIDPADETLPDTGPQIATTCVLGLRQIEDDVRRPEGFSDDALEHVAALSGVMNDGVRGIGVVTPLVPHPALLTPRTPEHIGEVLAQGYSLGGVEGQLGAVSVHGQAYFTVYDAMSGRAVRCYFHPSLQRKVIAALGFKVFVHGTLRRDAMGRPTQIREIDEFTALGTRTVPVPSSDLPGLFNEIEGSTQDYLAKIRGESD